MMPRPLRSHRHWRRTRRLRRCHPRRPTRNGRRVSEANSGRLPELGLHPYQSVAAQRRAARARHHARRNGAEDRGQVEWDKVIDGWKITEP